MLRIVGAVLRWSDNAVLCHHCMVVLIDGDGGGGATMMRDADAPHSRTRGRDSRVRRSERHTKFQTSLLDQNDFMLLVIHSFLDHRLESFALAIQ